MNRITSSNTILQSNKEIIIDVFWRIFNAYKEDLEVLCQNMEIPVCRLKDLTSEDVNTFLNALNAEIKR